MGMEMNSASFLPDSSTFLPQMPPSYPLIIEPSHVLYDSREELEALQLFSASWLTIMGAKALPLGKSGFIHRH